MVEVGQLTGIERADVERPVGADRRDGETGAVGHRGVLGAVDDVGEGVQRVPVAGVDLQGVVRQPLLVDVLAPRPARQVGQVGVVVLIAFGAEVVDVGHLMEDRLADRGCRRVVHRHGAAGADGVGGRVRHLVLQLVGGEPGVADVNVLRGEVGVPHRIPVRHQRRVADRVVLPVVHVGTAGVGGERLGDVRVHQGVPPLAGRYLEGAGGVVVNGHGRWRHRHPVHVIGAVAVGDRQPDDARALRYPEHRQQIVLVLRQLAEEDQFTGPVGTGLEARRGGQVDRHVERVAELRLQRPPHGLELVGRDRRLPGPPHLDENLLAVRVRDGGKSG